MTFQTEGWSEILENRMTSFLNGPLPNSIVLPQNKAKLPKMKLKKIFFSLRCQNCLIMNSLFSKWVLFKKSPCL